MINGIENHYVVEEEKWQLWMRYSQVDKDFGKGTLCIYCFNKKNYVLFWFENFRYGTIRQ